MSKNKLKELEDRIKKLEDKPAQLIPCPYPVPQPYPVYPVNPYPYTYPYPWTVWCGDAPSAGTITWSSGTTGEATGGDVIQ